MKTYHRKSYKSSKKHKHKRSYRKDKKHRYRSSSSSSESSSTPYSSSSSTAKRRRAPHYRFKVGEKLGHKYRIQKLLGDGTFGRVVEATYKDKSFAIKIIKPVPKYIESAKTERSIIKHINDRDPHDQQGIVRYVQSFYHRSHFCLVFKPLGKSLYDVIKMNSYKGFPIKLVQSFFRQTLKSIGFLHRIGYTHTDLKPQNILLEHPQLIKRRINEQEYHYEPASDKIRIIDFGGATKYDQHHSSIINTRQYRSPQVILECGRWNQISDVWSIGCIIAQLYVGQLLFNTHNDYQHLFMIQKNSGYFPQWMISKTPSTTLKRIFRDGRINQELLDQQIDHWENIMEMKTVKEIFAEHKLLGDLVMKCLEIDPNNRINCHNALNHPYFQIQY